MKRLNVAVAAVAAACVLFVAACSGGDPKADEDAIKAINAKWQELIVAKDAKAIAALYAEDGELMPPNAPKAIGRAAIEQGWTGILGIPGVTLTFETEKLVLAKSGDVAVDINNYQFGTGEGAAPEIGKSVVTWVKRDGKWFVLTDMFSSDAAPAVPAAATVPEGAPLPEGAPAEATTGPAPDATAPAPEGATPAPESAPATPTPN